MGRPKAFLPYFPGNLTFLGRLAAAAHGAGTSPVLVVGRPGDPVLEAESARLGARFVENPLADRGQLSSLIAALDSFDPSPPEAVVLLPIDIPVISSEVIRKLMTAAAGTAALIVRAAHNGQHGHPVLFKRPLFDELRAADPSAGARAVVRVDPARVLDVETGEPGVLIDIDTPEDYERVFGRPL